MKFNSILSSTSAAVGAAFALAAPAGAQCQYSVIQWSPWQCVWEGTKSYSAAGLNDLGAWCGRRTACWPEESGLELKDLPIYCPPGGMPQVLPMPPGASSGGAQATAVNNTGVVVGFKYVGASDQYLHGVIWWPDGSVETIPPWPGTNSSTAFDINDGGMAAGISGGFPYIYQKGEMVLLPDAGLGGGYALRVHASGDVVGVLGNVNVNARGFRWRNGSLTVLAPLAGFPVSQSSDVNSTGRVVGQSRTITPPGTGWPTIWIDDQPFPLPLPAGYTDGGARSINDAGVIVGTGNGPGLPTARMIWIDGEVHLLSTLTVPGSPPVGSIVRINQAGQLLGSGGPRLWSPTWHSPMDLNGDCAVNGNDLGVLLASWGAPDFDPRCDFNGDGIVDGHDLGTLLGAWTVN